MPSGSCVNGGCAAAPPPDSYSKFAGNPSPLGTLNCGQSLAINGTTSPAGTSDWFVVTWFSTACSQLRLIPRLNPGTSAGIVFDIDIDAAGDSAANALGSGNTTGCGGPACGVSAPGTYYIRIYATSGTAT